MIFINTESCDERELYFHNILYEKCYENTIHVGDSFFLFLYEFNFLEHFYPGKALMEYLAGQ